MEEEGRPAASVYGGRVGSDETMPDEVDNFYTSSESEDNGDVKQMAPPERGLEGEASSAVAKKAGSAKDPSRPKRRKARRACHACQRAHLTCGAYYSAKARSEQFFSLQPTGSKFFNPSPLLIYCFAKSRQISQPGLRRMARDGR